MQIEQIYTGSPLRNFSYIVHGGDGFAYVIDPFYSQQIVDALDRLQVRLRAIINTHEHWDHTRGNAALRRHTGCEVWAHAGARHAIPDIDRVLAEDDVITFTPQQALKVLDTPGHTFAHVCLLTIEDGRPASVFCGDTLFNAGVGNCHNGGDAETLARTIRDKLCSLPDDVRIYPGHEYWENNLRFTLSIEPHNRRAQELLVQVEQGKLPRGTIALEREVNTFVRVDTGDRTAATQEFLRLRALRDEW